MDVLGKLIGDAEKNAAKAIQAAAGDYLNDAGLLMCGKCHTPKQIEIEILGQKRRPMCLCRCAQERREAEKEKREAAEAEERKKEARAACFPDADMEAWRFENDDAPESRASRIARRYVDHFPEMQEGGKGLLLFGAVGTGKTFLAACIANALLDAGNSCMVTNFARLVNTVSGMREGKQEYLDSLTEVDLLVIDDLASERDTEYMAESVYSVIDARYRARKPLIVTTNLTADELKRPAEMRKQRIYSRLFEACIPVEVAGSDRRRGKLREDMKKYNDILGLGK